MAQKPCNADSIGRTTCPVELRKVENCSARIERETDVAATTGRKRAESHPTAAVCERNCRTAFGHDLAGCLRAMVGFGGLVTAKATCEPPEPPRLSSHLGGFCSSQALQALGAVMSPDAGGLLGAVDGVLRLCVNR